MVRVKYKINKANNLYTSEYKDSFREVQYSPEEKGLKIGSTPYYLNKNIIFFIKKHIY